MDRISNTMRLTASPAGRAIRWPGTTREDSSRSITTGGWPSSPTANSVIHRFWPRSRACWSTRYATTSGSSSVRTNRSPITWLKAPTLQAVSGSPSMAWNGRSPGVKVTGLPYPVESTRKPRWTATVLTPGRSATTVNAWSERSKRNGSSSTRSV